MILVLGGTGEARALSGMMAQAGVQGCVSLAGVTHRPRAQGLPVRIGGFGGDEGLRDYLTGQGVRAVVDATHPFATTMTERAARICAALNLPLLRLTRPAWDVQPGWVMGDWGEIPALIPPNATVLLATGPKELTRLMDLRAKTVLCRRVDAADAPCPLRNGRWIVSRPPFTVTQERDLMAEQGVTHLVCKNSGGDAGRAKLIAAQDLGVQVVMIHRPETPDLPTVATPEQVMEWIRCR